MPASLIALSYHGNTRYFKDMDNQKHILFFYLSPGWEKEDLLQIAQLVDHNMNYCSCEIMNFSLLCSWFVMHYIFSRAGLKFMHIISHYYP